MRNGYFWLMGFCFVAAVMMPGCASTDALTIQNMERARTIWQEDRRADLDPAKIEAREFEFEQMIEYEKSK